MSEPTTNAAPDFSKFPATPPVEDRDGDGLVDPPDGKRRWFRLWLSARWYLWITDAATAFMNGCWDGTKPGLFVGGVAAVNSDAPDVSSRAAYGTVGMGSSMISMGMLEFHDFKKKTPMPNPFRP